jgi:hypothetical protein
VFRAAALERLTSPEALDELMHVTSPRAWLALLALACLLLAAVLWAIFTTVTMTVSASGVVTTGRGAHGLGAIVYVTQRQARQVRPGMSATLTVADANLGQPIPVGGTVASVSAAPASRQAMLRALGSPVAVQLLAASGAVVPVQLRIAGAGSGGNGLAAPQSQAVAQAVITLDRQRLISTIVP